MCVWTCVLKLHVHRQEGCDMRNKRSSIVQQTMTFYKNWTERYLMDMSTFSLLILDIEPVVANSKRARVESQHERYTDETR